MRTLLTNGRIYSPWASNAGAMLIDGTDIAWLGDVEAASTMTADRTVDLAGALVLPAFVDAHFHATATGLALTGLDLWPAASLAAALALVEQHARAGRGRPLLGSGWDETRWPEHRPLTAAELDRASYGGVVYLARTDAHSAVVSSALMASVPGLAAMEGYSPSGHLTKQAHHAARAVALSAITSGQRADLHRGALRHAASLGVAAVHEMAGPEISSAEDLTGLLSLAGAGAGNRAGAGAGAGAQPGTQRRTDADAEPLPEVYAYWGELRGIHTALELGAIGAGGDLFCDGSIGSHTAGLRQPYADSDTSGYLRFETAELAEHIRACTESGLQAGFHAIGDAATDQVVAAMRLAQERFGGAGVFGAGHRIEHSEMVTDVAALASTGLTASVQPAFDATWGGPAGMYAERLGADRASTLNPFAALAAAGVPLALGSDSPVTAVDPWGTLRAATHPSNPGHALSPRAALNAHTRGGWRAALADADGSGVLAPGSPATYAIFAAGSLGVDAPDERLSRWSTDERSGVPGLPDLAPGAPLPRCLRTVVRGQQIFDSGELA